MGSGSNINASTFVFGSFQIENLSTAGEVIESVRYEFAGLPDPDDSRTLFPDMVFDPDGSAGDTTAKPFSADLGATATGFLNHQLDTPKGVGGFTGLRVHFADFDAGETFAFSIDVDPSSIRGVGSPGPGESGSVSGLELLATRVIVAFDDGASFALEGETFSCQGGNPACAIGNVQASEVFIEHGRPPAPTLDVTATATPAFVEGAAQTVRVTGTPGHTAVLLVVEGALFTDGVPGGGFDIDPFEANSAASATSVTEYSATLDGTGVADFAILLNQANPSEGGINHLAAIEIDSAGRTSDVSNLEVLALSVIRFEKSVLSGAPLFSPTTLQFGPDGRLYVGQQNGEIAIFDVAQLGAANYAVSAHESITSVRGLPNHDDDGALNPEVHNRQVTGLLVVGSAVNPVIYVGSSDPRIGAGPGGTDTDLDTNSGILTRLTWNGSNWDHVDLVRGLPRSEENHSINGLALDPNTNTLYASIGGFTNLGAPSNNFAQIAEYALSAAVLAIDLDAIGNSTYDLPTLDDEERGGSGQPPENDPFGGNDGKNQARLVAGGPVQIHSPGWRNAYDIAMTESGRLYIVDNGGNGGWGAEPQGEGPGGFCSNALQEPGHHTQDNLHWIPAAGYYGGHPNPTRGNRANTFNPTNPQSPVPFANAVECDFREPGVEDGAIATFTPSTNGLSEYRSSFFDEQLRGDLLLASFDNAVTRVKLNEAGDAALRVETLFSSVGALPLDLTTQDDDGAFPGTIWVADYGAAEIVIYEPDLDPGPLCTGADDPALDEDDDGFDNADEIDNVTNPCNAADFPPDFDGDFHSDKNDPDDDNDAQPDLSDPFAIDPDNGSATHLPVLYSWDNSAPPVGGLLGLGFTGLMTNGSSNYADLFDPDNMAAGGAAGVTTVESVPPGDAATDDQEYGFQFGFVAGTRPFVISTLIAGPFAGLAPTGDESMGVFVGLGDQDHYAKVVVTRTGVAFAHEVGGTLVAGGSATLAIPGPDAVELQLQVDPVAGGVQAQYRVTTAGVPGPLLDLGTPVDISWLSGSSVLAAGILSTSAGGEPFPATWGFLNVVSDSAPVLRLNVGGPTLPALDGGTDWLEDDAFALEGRPYTSPEPVSVDASVAPSVPTQVFQTERWDEASAPEMSWHLPVPAGVDYEVRLFFAEIFNGITGPGKRIFDVSIDGAPVLSNFDIHAEVGADVGTRRSFVVRAATDTLLLEFAHKVQNPKLSAVEIVPLTNGPGNTPPTLVNPGDQSDLVGALLSLAVVASDPDLDLLRFEAANLPEGLSIDAATGVIAGTPLAVGERTVTIRVDDGVHPPVSVAFDWEIRAGGTASLAYRVNAGGPTLPALDGLLDWSTDTGFVNTGNSFSSSENVNLDASVPAPTPAAVFHTERWDPGAAPEMRWSFPAAPGVTYEVRLYFAEIFNGISVPGQRVFDIEINGQPMQNAFDIFAEVGPDVGLMRSATVVAGSNTLEIELLHILQHPKISALEILALPAP